MLILFVLLCFRLLSVGLNYTGWINLGNFSYPWVAYRLIECVTNGKSRVVGIEIGEGLRHNLIFLRANLVVGGRSTSLNGSPPPPSTPRLHRAPSKSHVYVNAVIGDRRARPTLDEIAPIPTDGNSNRQGMPHQVSFYGQLISSFLYFFLRFEGCSC